jgi:hypothetical protein
MYKYLITAIFSICATILVYWYFDTDNVVRVPYRVHELTVKRDILLKHTLTIRNKWRKKYDTLIQSDSVYFTDSVCAELLGHCSEENDNLWAIVNLDTSIQSQLQDTLQRAEQHISQLQKERAKRRKGERVKIGVSFLIGFAMRSVIK